MFRVSGFTGELCFVFQPLGEGELRAAYLEKGQQAGATKPESSEAIQQPSKSGWGSVVTEGGTEGEEEGEDEFGDDFWEEVELTGAESPDVDGYGSDGAAMGTDNTGDGGDLEGSDRRAASLGVGWLGWCWLASPPHWCHENHRKIEVREKKWRLSV